MAFHGKTADVLVKVQQQKKHKTLEFPYLKNPIMNSTGLMR